MTEPRLVPPRVSPRDYEAGYAAAVADVIEHGLEVARQEVRLMLAARPATAPPAVELTAVDGWATLHEIERRQRLRASPPVPAKRPPGLPPRP